MARLRNPVDTIESVLGKYELEWEDMGEEKLENIIANTIRRDINYVKIEELLERSVGIGRVF